MIDIIDYTSDGSMPRRNVALDAAADPTNATIAFEEWGNDARAAADF